MHPYDHARSSAHIHGGAIETYLPMHQWFDATKVCLAHTVHRALRHHREGVAEAAALFGAALAVPGAAAVAVHALGMQHLAEDTGRLPSAADWLVHLDGGDLFPAVTPAAAELAERSAKRFGGAAARYLPLHRWFLETAAWMDDPRHLAMRHHSFGIFAAESALGVTLGSPAGSKVPTRVVAEQHVRAVMGRIPTASSLLQRIRVQRWMAAATSPRKLGLR